MQKFSSGSVLVLILIAAGIAGGGATWWNYSRVHPSTRDAFLSRMDPPVVTAVFSHTHFLKDKKYSAMVTIHGADEKYSGRIQSWKNLDGNRASAEILLTSSPKCPLDSPCEVSLDLELQTTSN
ncbi:MAG: hypothetical protein ABIP97_11260 [Chthoniobacterales bacterium]